MVSGIMLSNHVFAWLGIESGASFARTAHLLASHWYYVFMSLHIGLHVSLIANRLGLAGAFKSMAALVATRVVAALVAGYGIYAFARNLRLRHSRALEILVPAAALLLL